MMITQVRCRISLLLLSSIGSTIAADLSDLSQVFLAGIFDVSNLDWGHEIFNFTVSLINNKTDNWHDDILVDTDLNFQIANSACDASSAVKAYWNLKPMHGVVGAWCSGASTPIARIAALENVPQISMSSTSEKLSDKDEFPLFSRVVAPDNTRGQVGALVATVRLFGWDSVTILTTDTPYSKDLANEFRRIWQGDVAYSGTIGLAEDGSVDPESVIKVLDGVPTNNPTVNSRIVLLLAHSHHAYPILKIATETKFQPDTVFVGTDGWVGRESVDGNTSWMPSIPGYLGVAPFRNRNQDYQNFLKRLQQAQQKQGKEVWTDLPDYPAEHIVDAILAMSMALSNTPPALRHDGDYVTKELRKLEFDGISGRVSFTPEGDRHDPQYTIFNLQQQSDGSFDWIDVGSIGTTIETATLNEENGGIRGVCFAGVGCGRDSAPASSYPIPKDKIDTWVLVVIPLIGALLLFFVFKYIRGRNKKKALKERIDKELSDIDQAVEKAKKRQEKLILERGALQAKPKTWSDDAGNKTLVEVTPDSEQYWNVTERLQDTMPDAHISKLWRVQNTSLWSYYSFHKDRLTMNEIDQNEREVWHGTSSLDPKVIYNDRQDGFMMQFSRDGFWGRGIYFADKSEYSHSYSYRATSGSNDRPRCRDDEREMFLAKLLAGSEVLMDRDESVSKRVECSQLTVPPTDLNTNLKYNTVTGFTGGSQVWIVYENGRAYPDYLVRYYRGTRDSKRTPYESRKDALNSGTSSYSSTDNDDLDQIETGLASWEYLDNSGWKPYSAAHKRVLETAYQAFKSNSRSNTSLVTIKTGEWTYEVDVDAMVQTNTQHPDGRQRAVRRYEVV